MIPHGNSELECKSQAGDEKVIVSSLSVQVGVLLAEGLGVVVRNRPASRQGR